MWDIVITPKALPIKARGRAAHPGNAWQPLRSGFLGTDRTPRGFHKAAAAARGAAPLETVWNPYGVLGVCRASAPRVRLRRPWAGLCIPFGEKEGGAIIPFGVAGMSTQSVKVALDDL